MSTTDTPFSAAGNADSSSGSLTGQKIIDDSFNKHFTRDSSLCILLRENRLSYAVFDEERRKFIVHHTSYFKNVVDRSSYLSELRSVIGSEEFLHLPFKHVRVGLGNGPSALVPADLFVEEELGAHLQIQVGLEEHDMVRVDSLPAYDAMLEYSVDRELLNYLLDTFERPNLFHSNTALLKAFNEERIPGRDQIFIHVHKEAFTIVCFKQSRLQLMNTFEFRSKEDFIYYILAVCRELDVDPERAQFTFLGEVVKESAIFELSLKYLRQVDLGDRPKNLNYNKAIRDLPQQFHYNLFSVQLCE